MLCVGIIISQSWGKVSVFVTLSEEWRTYQASGSARSASPGITCAHAPVSSCRGQNWGPPEAGLSTDALADVTVGHAWVDARLGGGALPFLLLGEKDAEGTKLTVMANGGAGQETDWRSPEKRKTFPNHFFRCMCHFKKFEDRILSIKYIYIYTSHKAIGSNSSSNCLIIPEYAVLVLCLQYCFEKMYHWGRY